MDEGTVIVTVLATMALFGIGTLTLAAVANGRPSGGPLRPVLVALAGRLEAGRVLTPQRLLGGIAGWGVDGRREGHAVQLRLRTDRGGESPLIGCVCKVEVPHGFGRFRVRRRGELSRWLFGRRGTDWFDDQLTVDQEEFATERQLQSRELREVIRELFELGLRTFEQRGGQLIGVWRGATYEVNEHRLDQLLGGLVRAAKLCERRRVHVASTGRIEVRESFGWTAGGGEVLCPYCRSGADPAQGDAAVCESCGTLHHAECYAELGKCTILACDGRAATPVQA